MLNIYNIMIFKSKNGYKYDIDAAIFDIKVCFSPCKMG